MENLLGDFEFEVQVSYLLYRNDSQEVNGIWFYNTRECEDVANLFTRYITFIHFLYAKLLSLLTVSISQQLDILREHV